MVTATFYARGTSGAPSATPLPLPFLAQSISFSSVTQGGDESAEIVGTMPIASAQLWMDQLQAGVIITDRSAARVWRGFVASVEIDDGVSRAATTIEGMANEIRVQYTLRGGPKTTSAASNSTSVARYGRHQLILNGGELKTPEAESRRDTYLSTSAWPRYDSSASLRRGQRVTQATVSLRCRGWWSAMYWALLNYPEDAALTAVRTQTALLSLVVAAMSDSTYGNAGYLGTLDNSAYEGPYTRVKLFLSTYHLPTTDGWQVIGQLAETLAARGDVNGERIAYGLDPRLTGASSWPRPGMRARAWAGATPSTTGYYIRGNEILGPALTPVSWPTVRPNAMVRRLAHTSGFPPAGVVDTPARFYLDRVQYQWTRGQGETLTLEPLSGGSAASILARIK